MIKEIDRVMVSIIETMKRGEGKRKAIDLRNITIPLLFFILEHNNTTINFYTRELFVILEGELNNLDPIGNSIRVTGEQIYADRVNKKLGKKTRSIVSGSVTKNWSEVH
jgi:hypothetical protein